MELVIRVFYTNITKNVGIIRAVSHDSRGGGLVSPMRSRCPGPFLSGDPDAAFLETGGFYG